MDDTPELAKFAADLEAACVETIDQDGIMTKDLALAMKGKDMARGDWVTTDEYMKRVNVSEAEASPRTRIPSGRCPRCRLCESKTDARM